METDWQNKLYFGDNLEIPQDHMGEERQPNSSATATVQQLNGYPPVVPERQRPASPPAPLPAGEGSKQPEGRIKPGGAPASPTPTGETPVVPKGGGLPHPRPLSCKERGERGQKDE